MKVTLAGMGSGRVPAMAMASVGLATMASAAWLDLSSGSRRDLSAAELAVSIASVVITAGLGMRIVSRVPRQPIGWILLAISGIGGIVQLAEVYAFVGLVTRTRVLPAAATAEVVSEPSWVLGLALLTALVVLFPDGRLPRPAWRPLGWLSIAAFSGAWAAATLRSGLREEPFNHVRNPVGVAWLAGAGQPLVAIFMIAMMGCVAAAAVAVVERYEASEGLERLQMKALAYAACLLPVSLIACYIGLLFTGTDIAAQVILETALVVIPLAVGLAVLRYRLYDIDRLINRTLVYGTLSVLLAAAFAGISLVVGVAVGRDSPWATATATLITVVCFRALRDKVQDSVDRRFARAKYHGRQVVARFLDELRADRDRVERLPLVLAEAFGDPSVELRLWLPGRDAYVDIDGVALDPTGPSDARVTTRVDRSGAHLGVMLHDDAVKQQPELLRSVLGDAALAIELARLRAEVATHLAYVAESRVRVIEAGYEERRRLERDLHDGAQQRLVSLGVSLRRLQRSLPTQARILEPALDQAVREIGLAIADLRRLAAGARPARLDDGLVAALRDLARGTPIAVDIVATPCRLSSSVEAAAYFVSCEAVTNAVKHSNASQITVTAHIEDGSLLVSIADDGVGGATLKPGSGLAGLTDRVEAHGGRITLHSATGSGTLIEVVLPCGS